MDQTPPEITFYTSDFCGHAWAMERFLDEHDVPMKKVNVSKDAAAREELVALNGGYASVPTLLFPDGTKLTEPSFAEVRDRLGIETPGLLDWIKSLVGAGE